MTEMTLVQVFPHPLYYNRLTGTFLHRDPDDVDHPAAQHTPAAACGGKQPYGATDEERERMMQWAKDERLPMFFRYENHNNIVNVRSLHGALYENLCNL